MDSLIIGAGAVGAMAAWRLARAGHSVTVLEQFQTDHDLGSSYGESRIVRRVYPDAVYTALMAESYRLWEELQGLFPAQELFTQSGGIFFGPADHPQLRDAEDALAQSGVDYERLDAAQCGRRFPGISLVPGEIALHEPSMGYARASLCVRAVVQLASEQGARFTTGVRIRDIAPDAGGFRVACEDGSDYHGERLLLAAGPWTGPLLARHGVRLPLRVTRQPYIHLSPATHAEEFEAGRFPVWIDAAANIYGFPRLGSLPGVKLASHDTGGATTPEAVYREVTDADREPLRSYARSRLPWLGAETLYEKVCLYTCTPDNDFIVDAVPGWSGAFLIAGLSGHGFKFAPLLGEAGADLMLGAAQPRDLSRFRLDRFG